MNNHNEIARKAGIKLRKRILAGMESCDCGGPQYGTAHAPNCRIELAYDDIKADIRQDEYEKENA